jgi:hypothetical protein
MIWKILRWLFGGYYLLVGVLFGLTLVGVLPPHKLAISPRSAAFQQALVATGFVMPILIATYIAGGAALLFVRTAPLGLALLAPAVVMITLTDLVLDTAYAVAAVNLVVFLALAWRLRAAYRPMWTFVPELSTDR